MDKSRNLFFRVYNFCTLAQKMQNFEICFETVRFVLLLEKMKSVG